MAFHKSTGSVFAIKKVKKDVIKSNKLVLRRRQLARNVLAYRPTASTQATAATSEEANVTATSLTKQSQDLVAIAEGLRTTVG